MSFGGLNTMWVIVLFDLPTTSKIETKNYTRFRSHLLKDGFSMMQYSVYSRHCASEENAKVHCNRITSVLPPDGEVRMVRITDKQFGKIEIYYGKKRKPTEKPPS